MKSLFIILFCFLSLCLASCKEETPTENIENEKVIDQSLFPLQIGNVWVYQLTDLSKEYWTVIGTDVVDDKTYYKIEIKNPLKGTYRIDNYRIDSQTGFLYRGGAIQTNLSYDIGNYEVKSSDGYTYLWITVSTISEHLFGVDQKAIIHEMGLQETSKNYKFVGGIGIVQKYASGYLGYGEYNDVLIGAIIDNFEYGDTSLVEYDSDIYFYPLSTGNKWYFDYNKYIENGDTIRSTKFKREIVGEELMSNGVSYFKIKNTFDDSLNISYYDWQKLTIAPPKLYGFDIISNKQYVIEDYTTDEYGFESAESYMPSVLKHHLIEISVRFTDQIKTYSGWNSGAACFSTGGYDFIKGLGISKIEFSFSCDTTKIIEKINLIGSEIDGNISGMVW